eukprot:RCo018810
MIKWFVLSVLCALLGLYSPDIYRVARACFFGSAFEAAEVGSISRLRALQAQGVLLNLTDSQTGNTLLHHATDPATIDFLVEQGVDVNLPNSKGLSPLSQLLANHSDRYGAREQLSALLANDANLDDVLEQTRTPPVILVWKKWETISQHRLNLTQTLLHAGAFPTDTEPETQATVLHYLAALLPMQKSKSVQKLILDTVMALLDEKEFEPEMISATVNSVDRLGSSPLMSLIHMTSPYVSDVPAVMQMVNLLLATGADPTLMDVSGISPLCYAAFRGVPEMVTRLLSAVQAQFEAEGGGASGGPGAKKRIPMHVSRAMGCAMFSPALDIAFAPSTGVVSILAQGGAVLTNHHLSLFEATWDSAQDAPNNTWQPHEMVLFRTSRDLQKDRQPNLQDVAAVKQRLEELAGKDPKAK